jgi:hypothetical protein
MKSNEVKKKDQNKGGKKGKTKGDKNQIEKRKNNKNTKSKKKRGEKNII